MNETKNNNSASESKQVQSCESLALSLHPSLKSSRKLMRTSHKQVASPNLRLKSNSGRHYWNPQVRSQTLNRKQKAITPHIQRTLMTYLTLTASLLNVAFVLLVNTDSGDDEDDDVASVWLSSVNIRRSASTHLASYIVAW